MKYLILVISISFYIFSKFKNKISYNEICVIGLIGGTTYCILDLMSPTIHLTIDEKCGPNPA